MPPTPLFARGRGVLAVALALTLTLAVTLVGCSAPPGSKRAAFPAVGQLDYQLGEAYPVPSGTTIVTRDSTEVPAPGVFSICYVNGFQSQPADTADWLSQHPDLVLGGATNPVVDANWPDEIIFDTSTSERRKAIAALIQPTLERCARAGFDAVEIDNLDSFTRSDGALTAVDNIALVTVFAAEAHRLGLGIGQKNSADLASRLRSDVGFDFAVAEECDRFEECTAYTDAYGSAFLDVEYSDDLRDSFAAACARRDRPPLMVLRDRDLVAAGSPGYVFEVCPG